MLLPDPTMLRMIEITTVLCLAVVLLLFSGGEARRVLRFWAAAGLAFFVREVTALPLKGVGDGLLADHMPWPLISQFAEHVVLVMLVAGAYELRGGARVTRSAVSVGVVLAFLFAAAVVFLPGVGVKEALGWRGAIAVTCAAGMLGSMALLRAVPGAESRMGRRVLLVTLVLLAIERLATGYHDLAGAHGWATVPSLDLLPIVELALIVVGLMATVVVLLEREQGLAQARREAADQARRELQARDAWFSQLIDGAADIITVLDAEGTILFESPAVTRVLGWETHENLGQPALRLVHPDDQPRVASSIEGVVAGAVAVGHCKYRYRARNGSWRVLESEGREVAPDHGRRRFVVNTRDVTEREDLEQRLVHSGKMESVGRLAGGVAHDFNNLLTVIMSNAALARAAAGPEGPVRELEEIAAAGARAARLTSQLLAFSRQQVVALQPVDLAASLPPLIGMLQRLVGERIELATDLAAGLPPVVADAGQVDQVLTNLVVNARDAMPDGGRIVLRVAEMHVTRRPPNAREEVEPGTYVALRVSDNGPGVAASARERLFEPFFTTKERGRGTGLGLATCYGIVRRHGGHIWHEDELPGGAAFVVLLPAAARDAVIPPAPVTPSMDQVRGSESILLVEDDARVRETTRRILVEFGYTVATARHGEEALEHMHHHPLPDLVVTDVVMPRMDGIALRRQLRILAPDLPVILVSGYSEHPSALEEERVAHTRYVAKPFTPLQLLGVMRTLLDARVAPMA